MKAFRLLILVVMAMLVAFAWAGGTASPPTTLPVGLNYRDDGAHAFMPKLEPAIVPGKFALPVQDPDPNPIPSWSGAWLYRVTGSLEDRASAGAVRNITTLSRGKTKLSLDAYAGLTLRLAVPVAAILLGYQWKPFDQDFTIGIHAGAIVSGSQPTGGAFGLSANLRF